VKPAEVVKERVNRGINGVFSRVEEERPPFGQAALASLGYAPSLTIASSRQTLKFKRLCVEITH
jgi:hypothetical protein